MTTVCIEKLSHDGRGIARINGKTTFIDGALAGEEVTFEYTRKKRDFDEGRVLTVEKASPDRVAPRCAHHGMCGGCSLQHLNASAQIHVKEALMLDVLNRIGHVTPKQVLPVLSDENAWGYRNRARLSVNVVPKKGRVLVGFREKRNPRYVADIQQCEILNEKVGHALLDLSVLIGEMTHPKSFAQVEVAVGDDAAGLVFRHLEPLTPDDESRLKAFSDKTGFRIFLQPKGLDSVHLFYPKGDDMLHYRLPNENVRFAFYPTDFTQVNARLNQLMVTQAIDWLKLGAEDTVLDLFCGLGNFSLPMAQVVKSVFGVEGSETMVQRAGKNAALNQIKNTQFAAANLADEASLALLKQHDCNKLLLDPPRTGALEIVNYIEQIDVDTILYVSCNPATFARDAGVLVHEKGYELTQVAAMDMFPHTTHVEVMGLFKKG